MPNKMTVSVPDELVKKFKQLFPEVNLAAVARNIVINKVEELSKLEKTKEKNK